MSDKDDNDHGEHDVAPRQRGRPKGKNKNNLDTPNIQQSRRRSSLLKSSQLEAESVQIVSSPRTSEPAASAPSPRSEPPPSGSSQSQSSHSSARNKKLYLLGHSLEKLSVSKLPKNSQILRRFFGVLKDCEGSRTEVKTLAVSEAATIIAEEIREVWRFHFGLKLIFGKETDYDNVENESLKLIVRKDVIKEKILKLFKNWKD